jgi:hypothetical protein
MRCLASARVKVPDGSRRSGGADRKEQKLWGLGGGGTDEIKDPLLTEGQFAIEPLQLTANTGGGNPPLRS